MCASTRFLWCIEMFFFFIEVVPLYGLDANIKCISASLILHLLTWFWAIKLHHTDVCTGLCFKKLKTITPSVFICLSYVCLLSSCWMCLASWCVLMIIDRCMLEIWLDFLIGLVCIIITGCIMSAWHKCSSLGASACEWCTRVCMRVCKY